MTRQMFNCWINTSVHRPQNRFSQESRWVYCTLQNATKARTAHNAIALYFRLRRLNIRGPLFKPLTPNDRYSGRTAPLTSKRCILYIYSTNTGTEYFKHGINAPFYFFLSLSLQNAVCFIILMYLVPVLYTFYIQVVLKVKKK